MPERPESVQVIEVSVYKRGVKFKPVRVPEKKDPHAGKAVKLKCLMALASLQQHPSSGKKQDVIEKHKSADKSFHL